MPRWLEITLTLLLFAAFMTVFGMGVNAVVPGVHAWLIEHVGRAGPWALIAVIAAVCAFVLYRARVEKPKGT